MNRTLYQIVYYPYWCFNRVRIGLHLFFMWTPWGKAYICTAFKKYLESDWFKERSELFVRRRALEMYFDHNESWFFKRGITRKEKLRIVLMPFSCINHAQKIVREKGVADYI